MSPLLSSVTFCAYSGSYASLLFANTQSTDDLENGLGVADTGYITADSYIEIEGLDSLPSLSIMVHGSGSRFAVYGTNTKGSNSDSSLILSASAGGYFYFLPPSYMSYRYLNVVSTSGEVLLAQLSYTSCADAAAARNYATLNNVNSIGQGLVVLALVIVLALAMAFCLRKRVAVKKPEPELHEKLLLSNDSTSAVSTIPS